MWATDHRPLEAAKSAASRSRAIGSQHAITPTEQHRDGAAPLISPDYSLNHPLDVPFSSKSFEPARSLASGAARVRSCGPPLAILFHRSVQLACWNGLRKEEALQYVAARDAKKILLVRGLDAFRRYLQP